MASLFKVSFSCSFEYGSNSTFSSATQASEPQLRTPAQKPTQHRLRPLTTSRKSDRQQACSEHTEDIMLLPVSTACSDAAMRERELVADLRSLMLLEAATAAISTHAAPVETKLKSKEEVGISSVGRAGLLGSTTKASGSSSPKHGLTHSNDAITESSSQKVRFSINMPDVDDPFATGNDLRGKDSSLFSAIHHMQAKSLGELFKTAEELSGLDSASTNGTSPRSTTSSESSNKSPSILEGVGLPVLPSSTMTSTTRTGDDQYTIPAYIPEAGDVHKSIEVRVEVNESPESDRFSAYTASDESGEGRLDVHDPSKDASASSNLEQTGELKSENGDDREIEDRPDQRSESKSVASSQIIDKTDNTSASLYVSSAAAMLSMRIEQPREPESDVDDDWQIEGKPIQSPKESKPLSTSVECTATPGKTNDQGASLYLSSAQAMSSAGADQAIVNDADMSHDWDFEDRLVQSPERRSFTESIASYQKTIGKTDDASASVYVSSAQVLPTANIDQDHERDDDVDDEWEKTEDGDDEEGDLDSACW